jgi:hypothetical protein
MWKYAGELRVGDVWTERTESLGTRSCRVIAMERDLFTARVTGSCLATGQRHTMDVFLFNRVKVCKEPT